jgi:ketosteroid isomerase-like protein
MITARWLLLAGFALSQSALGGQEYSAGEVATALNQAISGGDADRIRSLMVDDVQIFESGSVESSLAEYASHHMESDMAFMGAMQSELISREVIEGNDLAAVLSRYRLQGNYGQRDIDLFTTETLVLKRLDGQWKVAHVHWSSR